MSTSWPFGTIATASSYHASQVVDSTSCPQGCYWTYIPSNAIDGNTTTFWNDDTLGVFPDTLTLNFPTASPVSLSGIQIVSNDNGYITSYDLYISVSSSQAPFKAASVTGITSSFSGPSSWNVANRYIDSKGVISGVTALEIVVNGAQGSPGRQYSRIGEVYPVYGVAAAASSASSSTSPTTTSANTPSSSASNTQSKSSGSSLRRCGKLINVAGALALIATVAYLF